MRDRTVDYTNTKTNKLVVYMYSWTPTGADSNYNLVYGTIIIYKL